MRARTRGDEAIRSQSKGGGSKFATENQREQAEWQAKRTLLGL